MIAFKGHPIFTFQPDMTAAPINKIGYLEPVFVQIQLPVLDAGRMEQATYQVINFQAVTF
jgi:hypothetical protein